MKIPSYSSVCRPGSGAGALFSYAALMALANSAFALTVPKPARSAP